MEKKLVICNGIVGLVGGIYLIIAPIFTAGAVLSDVSSSLIDGNVSVGSTVTSTLLPIFIKIAILVLGIVGAVKLKNTNKIGAAPSILLIVGGAVSLVPFLSFAGGIVAIIGGAMYLAKVKKFNSVSTAGVE